MKSIGVVLLLSVTLACGAVSAEAKGCLKGAAVGAVGGHVAGHHAVLGAVAGCAVGHHMANKPAANLAPPSGTSRPASAPQAARS